MTVVLLHPVGLDHECWQLTGLEGEKFDYPGHGDRPLPAEGFSLESIADEIVAKYPGPLDLVGVSMGTSVALNTAVRHPNRVRSMLVAAGGAGRSAKAPPPDPSDGSERARRPIEQLELGMAGTLDKTLRRWFTEKVLATPNHPGVAYVRRRWLANDPKAISLTWIVNGNSSVRDELPKINIPVTVVGGRFDVAATVQTVTELQSLLPTSRLEIIEGPHMLPLENPEEFAAAVRRHLAWAAEQQPAAAHPRAAPFD